MKLVGFVFHVVGLSCLVASALSTFWLFLSEVRFGSYVALEPNLVVLYFEFGLFVFGLGYAFVNLYQKFGSILLKMRWNQQKRHFYAEN